MTEDELELFFGEFPTFCPKCAHFLEHHIQWAHDDRDPDVFDPGQCRSTLDCRCTWLIDFVKRWAPVLPRLAALGLPGVGLSDAEEND